MQRLFLALVWFALLALPAKSWADGGEFHGRVIKVLPLKLNLQGRAALSPSLFDRDAYQFYLLDHTNQVSGIRYDVEWKASGVTNKYVDVVIELRAIAPDGSPRLKTLARAENPHRFSRWTSLYLTGSDYQNLGNVVAWRATLWAGDRLLGTQQSFLW